MTDKKTTIKVDEVELDNELSASDLHRIIELVTGVYAEHGRNVVLATLHEGDDTSIIIDNRDDDDLN